MADVPYRLVDSALRVRGVATTTTDPYEAVAPTVDEVELELVHRAAESMDGALRLDTGRSQELRVQLSPDGRLQSLGHHSVGPGAAVVGAGAKLIGFIGSIVLRARGGMLAGSRQDAAGDDPRSDWRAVHPEAADLLERHKDLARRTATKLVETRMSLADADELTTVRALAAQARMLADVLDAARAEVARLEATYAVWREAQTTSRTAAIECLLDFDDIPQRAPDLPISHRPEPPAADAPGHELWRDFRLLVEVVDPRRAAHIRPGHDPALDSSDQHQLVRWRIPRSVELWVWKGEGEHDLTLVSRAPIWIADERCDTQGMELHSTLFGEHGGAWTFHDDGSPRTIETTKTSAVSAAANALSSVPESLTSGATQAAQLLGAIDTARDGAAERRRAAAERELATAKARIELLGVNATAADVAALARAEQAVKLRATTRALSPVADELEELRQELELVTARADLAGRQRAAAIEAELADVRADVARLGAPAAER